MRFLLLVSILFVYYSGYSCSCIPHEQINDEQYNKYFFIFTGKVLSIKKTFGRKEVTFELQTLFKGTVKSKKMTIMTSAYESECDISPKIGEQWLVFAYNDSGEFTTNICTRTKSMNRKAWNYNKGEIQRDIEYLNQKLRG